MSILVNLAGVILIGLIIWWFWFSKQKIRPQEHDQLETIIVKDGVYTPAVVFRKAGKITLSVLRKDPAPAAEKMIFPALGVSEDLSLDLEKTISLEIADPGEYEFTCQALMYRGRLIVT